MYLSDTEEYGRLFSDKLYNLLSDLKCNVYIDNNHVRVWAGSERVLNLYLNNGPIFKTYTKEDTLQKVRELCSKMLLGNISAFNYFFDCKGDSVEYNFKISTSLGSIVLNSKEIKGSSEPDQIGLAV